MSLSVEVVGAKPSDLMRAFAAVCGNAFSPERWELLDRPKFLETALSMTIRKHLGRYESEHAALHERLISLEKLHQAFWAHHMSKQWGKDAREFLVAEMTACKDRIVAIWNASMFGPFLKSLLDLRLGSVECVFPFLMPGQGLCIEFDNGHSIEGVRVHEFMRCRLDALLLPCAEGGRYRGLRYASFVEARTFLEALGRRECSCSVQREGTGHGLSKECGFISTGAPWECRDALVAAPGRKIAHEIHPDFSEDGRWIPRV